MQQETTTATATPNPERATILDDLRAFARQHRELAKRNYEAFARQYGSPSDRLREVRERAKSTLARWRAEAKDGYTKLDRDIAAKSGSNGKVHVAPATNGASH